MRAAAEPILAAVGELPDTLGHYYFDPALQERRIGALTLRALCGQDVVGSIRRRRQNYCILVGLLQPELPADACPLNLPLVVQGRDAIAQRLRGEGIEATPWWAGYNRRLDWEGTEDHVS